MNYIFFIHSPITYIISREIIKYEKYNIDDCILITEDFYLEKVKTYNNIFKNVVNLNQKDFNVKTNNTLLNLDSEITKKIKRILKEKYILYIGHDLFFFSKYLAFNSLCQGYYYIEEGIASYNDILISNFKKKDRDMKSMSFYNKIKNYILNFNADESSCIIPQSHFHYSKKLIGTYSFSSKAFNFLEKNRITLSINNEEYKNELNNKIPIFVFDNTVNTGLCTLETLLNIIRDIFSKHVMLYIKFHPAQSQEERNLINNVINELNCKIIILEDSIILEDLFYKNLKIYGFFSSLLFYNQIFSSSGISISLVNSIFKIENKEFPKIYKFTIDFFKKNNIIFYE